MRLLALTAIFLFAISIYPLSASAHDQKEMTIILGEEGPLPNSISEGVLVQTDNLFFINVDDRANSSHRVQVDADNDGIFDGPDDLSTQWLSSYCAVDQNGSKIDNECMVNEFFLLAPENGLLPGNISMRHQISHNSEFTNHSFYVNFGPDIHSPVLNPPSATNTQADTSSDLESILALLLVISLLGVLITSQKISQLSEEE